MAASTVMRDLIRVARAGAIAGSLSGAFACGGDATGPKTALTAATAYWALQFPQHAVTLALTPPYNTIQLTATPLNADGQRLSGVGRPHYTASDSAIAIDSTGRVTAQFATLFRNAFVVASLADPAQGVTLADTCFIQVTPVAPASLPATLTIRPVPGDSAYRPIGGFGTVMVSATDSAGHSMAAPFVYFTSADPTIATVGPLTGNVVARRTGRVILYATTWEYGVAEQDSLQFTVGIPNNATISMLSVFPTGSATPVLTFWPQTVTVSVGAVVTWSNPSFSDSADVVFDDPTQVDSAAYSNPLIRFSTGRGNIAPWLWDTLGVGPVAARICTAFGGAGTPPDVSCIRLLKSQRFANQRLRKFPVAGTYHYRSRKWGTSGTIIVQ